MVIGGYNSANNPLDSTEIYADNVWKTVAGKLPDAMCCMAATNFENKVLSFGIIL